MWIYRRMLKISCQQHISNEYILVGLRPQLMKMVEERKCRYFGHIVRGERCEYQRLLLEGTVDGKRGRRPRNTWFSNIRHWMGIDYATAVQKAQDCDQWWSMVSKVPDRYGTLDWLIGSCISWHWMFLCLCIYTVYLLFWLFVYRLINILCPFQPKTSLGSFLCNTSQM